MRVWMGLSAVLFGTILGSFAGLGAYRWRHGDGVCSLPNAKGSDPVLVRCGAGVPFAYVAVSIGLGIVLCSLWTWWMLNRPSTLG